MTRPENKGWRREWPPVSLDKVKAAAQELAGVHPDIEAIFLFGSLAPGGARPSADVDLAVLLDWPVDELRESNADWFVLQREMAWFVEDRVEAPVDLIVIRPALKPELLFSLFEYETILFAQGVDRARWIAASYRLEYRDLETRRDRSWTRLKTDIARVADEIRRTRSKLP